MAAKRRSTRGLKWVTGSRFALGATLGIVISFWGPACVLTLPGTLAGLATGTPPRGRAVGRYLYWGTNAVAYGLLGAVLVRAGEARRLCSRRREQDDCPECVICGHRWPMPEGARCPACGHCSAFSQRLVGDAALPRCKGCGYNLWGNTSGVCPECGTTL